MPAKVKAVATTSFKAWCRMALPGACLHTKPWRPRASTWAPQRHTVWNAEIKFQSQSDYPHRFIVKLQTTRRDWKDKQPVTTAVRSRSCYYHYCFYSFRSITQIIQLLIGLVMKLLTVSDDVDCRANTDGRGTRRVLWRSADRLVVVPCLTQPAVVSLSVP